MKWIKALSLAFALAALGLVILLVATARKPAEPVGFQQVRVESLSGPIAVALLYPTTSPSWPTTFTGDGLLSVSRDGAVEGTNLPLIVISHGNGGSAMSHLDLALALASAGYVVAAPTHAGDNFADQSRQAEPTLFSQRADQLRSTIDYAMQNWVGREHLDPDRIGAFGFSAGGFTVLTLAGGKPRMSAISEHCRRSPGFICQALAQLKSSLLDDGNNAGTFVKDERLKAAVLAAPGLGFAFDAESLSDVRIPIQTWSGDRDETVPSATNTDQIAKGLGTLAETHSIPNASHFSFLQPCGLIRPEPFCTDPEGFDRVAAHKAMNAEVVEFFDSHMPPSSQRN